MYCAKNSWANTGSIVGMSYLRAIHFSFPASILIALIASKIFFCWFSFHDFRLQFREWVVETFNIVLVKYHNLESKSYLKWRDPCFVTRSKWSGSSQTSFSPNSSLPNSSDSQHTLIGNAIFPLSQIILASCAVFT